ncbi:hypothetical protein LSG31_03890 [Fodinisporobacter ferrooxydans]|uniref:Flagellar protein FlgN n=1 Tax=Fodinisporobacter ferrooxydans TaxID=2901836 RepID=A0ABY4CLM1_9BACL|nr:hypothetical protein LSG31_03890 [Alicyclobacillaceae bacterium MYW30-H2]
MRETRIEELAGQLVDCYKKLYNLSKKQQLIMTGQLSIDLQAILSERNELFATIGELQVEFQQAEEQLFTGDPETDSKIVEAIGSYREAFQKEIDRILKSDSYIQVIVDEKKRKIIDSIQLISRTQNAEKQYIKASKNKRFGYLFPDQSRFFDDKK